MKILVLAGWYPQYGRSGNGIFIVRHAEALVEAGMASGQDIQVDLMAVQPQSWMRGADQLSSPSPAITSSSPSMALPHLSSTEGGGSLRHWVKVYEDGGWGLVAWWNQFKAWRTLWAAYKAHHGSAPDKIVAQVSWKAAVVASCIDCPYVVVEHWSGWLQGHQPYPWWQRLLVYRALRRASGVFAVSAWLADAMRSRLQGLQVGIIPNAVESHFWSQKPRVSDLDSSQYLHISDLAPVKNPDLLRKAWVQSGLAAKGFRLRIAGEYNASRQEAFRGIQGIEWLGVLDSVAVVRELREARALLLPSLQETFSILTVESLLCRCPVWMGYGPLWEHYRQHPLVRRLDTADPQCWAEALADHAAEGKPLSNPQNSIAGDTLAEADLSEYSDSQNPTAHSDSPNLSVQSDIFLERYQSKQVGLELLDIVNRIKP